MKKMNLEKVYQETKKEGLLYSTIISTETVIFMTSFNIILGAGEFNVDIFLTILKALPIIWIIVMIIEPTIFGRIAGALVAKLTKPTDSFNSKILFHIIFTVLGMSVTMTFVCDIVGNGFTP